MGDELSREVEINFLEAGKNWNGRTVRSLHDPV